MKFLKVLGHEQGCVAIFFSTFGKMFNAYWLEPTQDVYFRKNYHNGMMFDLYIDKMFCEVLDRLRQNV